MAIDPRKRDLAKIHMAKTQLAMSDDSYRALLRRVTGGKDSASQLTATERAKVIYELERLGWAPKKATRKHQPEDWRAPRIRLIFRLWYWLYDRQVIRSRTPQSLLAFCQQHMDAEKLEWASSDELNKCVEALKSWQKRVESTQKGGIHTVTGVHNDLPQLAQDLIQLIGWDDAVKLMERFGGTYVDIPRDPAKATQLTEILSSAAVESLCAYYCGSRMEYVPKMDAILAKSRRAAVVREFGTRAVRDIALTYGITRQRVYQMVAEADADQQSNNQISLF